MISPGASRYVKHHFKDVINRMYGMYIFQENYDLQGLKVASVSLPWPPFLIIGGCDDEGWNCEQNSGFLMDLFGYQEKLLNFSLVSTMEEDEDWGVYPKSGPHDLSGTWGGVMGKV